MVYNLQFIKKNKGFTLIEGLVALAVFTILVVTFYKIFAGTMEHMQNSKYRRGAVALANERMEQFRNLAYEDVATTANAPVGDIEDDEVVNVNGLIYRIITTVFFVDDPVDGVAPTDTRYEDYKRVSVVVVWGPATNDTVSKTNAMRDVQYESKRITLVSQFVPPGGLEALPTGGVLSVNVLDTGVEPVEPVENAIVSITDNACGTTGHPDCSNSILTGTTDATGNFMYIGAPICTACYEISITKNGIEARETLDPFTGDDGVDPYEEGEYEPTYTHQGVSAGDVTTVTFNTNKLSQLNIISQDPFGGLIPGVKFDISGGLVVGTTVGGSVSSVYNLYAKNKTTDTTDADIDIYSTSDVINGDYANAGIYTLDNIVLPTGFTDYTFWKVDTNDEIDPKHIVVTTDADVKTKMIFIENDYDSAFIRVIETIGSDSVPVRDANVRLESTTLNPKYDVTLVTDEFGYVYFPENTTDGLVNGETYDITVTATDYDETTDTIEIDKLTQKDITITLSP